MELGNNNKLVDLIRYEEALKKKRALAVHTLKLPPTQSSIVHVFTTHWRTSSAHNNHNIVCVGCNAAASAHVRVLIFDIA